MALPRSALPGISSRERGEKTPAFDESELLPVHGEKVPEADEGRRGVGDFVLRIAGLFLLVAALQIVLAAASQAAPACPPPGANFRSPYSDPNLFNAAIARADASAQPAKDAVTGIAVPHHLLVAHLTAFGFRAASGAKPRRIVILSPDHFRRSDKPFAVATHGFETVFGPVPLDGEAARALLRDPDAGESCLFAAEHGVGAMLPFVRHYFPGVPVVAVAIASASTRAQWERFAETLAPLLGDGTLVVQSTDFSHFLPAYQARRFDQQVLNVLAAGSLDGIAALRQPAHLDSVGAFYMQAKLQAEAGARPLVVANENSQRYGESFVASTTSYMVILWGRFAPEADPPRPEASIVYLAGDTNFGRAMKRVLADERTAVRIERAVLGLTHGRPLVLNLEGVILPNVPEAIDEMTLAMPGELAIPWLRRLNVAGVSLANNHALDLGPSGLAETQAALARAGIAFAGQGGVLQLPGLDIVALSDLDTNAANKVDLLTPALLDALLREGEDRAVLAFVHWGREWITAPSSREAWLADEMARRAAAVIAGAHPHRASEGLQTLAGGDALLAYSLGNFLFDQTAARGASGAMLELTVFPQGTVFTRRLPLPNLFELRGN